MSDIDLRQMIMVTAHHEAGHAVAAVLRGGTLVSITVSDDGETGFTRHRSGVFDAGFIAYAGQWAEATYGARAGVLPHGMKTAVEYLEEKLRHARDELEWGDASELGDDHDLDVVIPELDQAREFLNLSAENIPDDAPPLMRESILREASEGGDLALLRTWGEELTEAWPVIQQVAALLVEGRTVTHADVRRLSQGVGRFV